MIIIKHQEVADKCIVYHLPLFFLDKNTHFFNRFIPL